MNHIIISAQQAEQIKGKYGNYSAIEPVQLPDGNFIIPERCIDDPDLIEAKQKIIDANGQVQEIIDLPESGQLCEANRVYRYNEGTENGYSGLVICVQQHNRTIYKPEETPALFSFFRKNSDTLEWIPNENVKLGWKRMYNGIQYEVIQPHMTLIGWEPDKAITLWNKVAGQEEPTELPPQWVSSEYYKYVVGYRVLDSGKIWEAINTTHTWIQPALSGNGSISWKFIADV